MIFTFFVVCFLEVCSVSLKSTDSQLLALQESLNMFGLARSKLESQQKVNDLNPISLDLVPEEWVLSKLIKRSKFSLKKEVLNIQLITLKPISIFRDTINSMNIGFLVGYSDGSIEILRNNGELLYEYDFGYLPKFLATTANYDEIKIAAISPDKKLEIYDFYMERLKNSQTDVGTLVFNITKESSDVLHCSQPTSLIFYVKSGKKFWLVGDDEGKISMHLMNGTMFKQEDLNYGKITAIERFGQTIISSTENSVIAVNQNTLKPDIVCNDIGKIKDFCIDTASNLAYVYALSTDKIIALDTRYQKGNDIYCNGNFYTVIGSKPVEYAEKIVCARNYIMTLGPNSLWMHNTSFYLNEKYNESILISGEYKKNCFLESHRVQNGGALVIVASESSIEFYEVVMPYKTAPPFDFGNIRLIM